MTWLFAFLIAHAPMYSLNKWACDTVNSQIPQSDPSGCYDWCLAHSMYQLTDGDTHDETGKITYRNDGKYYQRVPVGLDEDYSHELQNACAVVMEGGEY